MLINHHAALAAAATRAGFKSIQAWRLSRWAAWEAGGAGKAAVEQEVIDASLVELEKGQFGTVAKNAK